MRFPFAPWMPDQPAFGGSSSENVENVIPTSWGYRPLPSLARQSTDALAAKCVGAVSVQYPDGTAGTFVGTATKLYTYSGGTFTDVTRASSDYTLSDGDYWSFAKFGFYLIATAPNQNPQVFLLGTDTVFTDLGGTPPEAKYCATVRDFVLLGNLSSDPRAVQWSGFEDATQWTDGTNQSSIQPLYDGGQVNGVVGGEFGLIFQEHAVTRMTYIGPPVIFQFDAIETERGCSVPGSIIKVGSQVYYYGSSGFSVTDGNGSQSIGNEQVDQWFTQNADPDSLSSMTVAHDALNKLIIWGFVSNNPTTPTVPDLLLIYNYAAKRFAPAKTEHDFIFALLSEGLTLEQIGALYSTVEDVPSSLDAKAWAGGAPVFGAFDSSHYLATFTGPALQATIETQELELVEGRRSVVSGVRPLIDASDATVIVRSKDAPFAALTDTAATAVESNGVATVLSAGLYHRIQAVIPSGSDWSKANGVDVMISDEGEI